MCGMLPDRASFLVESEDFRPSLCAAACRRLPLLVATKGQKRATSGRKVSTQMAPMDFWRTTAYKIDLFFGETDA
jgi:hypothetical protein